MPNANLYDMSGKKTGDIELSEAVFGIKPSPASVHSVIRAHLAARRQGNQSTLTRAEVKGGGKKPYRQKGTGRARHGSTRSPQWTHGGVAFAPKPRDYSFSINKKIRRLAMLSALSQKAADGKIMVIDDLAMPEIKTKKFAEFLQNLGISGKSYVVTAQADKNIYKSANNLQSCKAAFSGAMSVYDIVNAETLILDKNALNSIGEVFGK